MSQIPLSDRAAVARALVMIMRYSVEITQIAVQSLGRGEVENRDVQLLLTVHANGPVTPTDLSTALGTAPSVVSRALRRLEDVGLVARTRDAGDRRSVLVTLTSKGRRRIAGFSERTGDYFVASEPLLKDAFTALDLPTHDAELDTPVDPPVALAELSRVGAAFVEDVTRAMEPFTVHEFADRFALALIFLYGQQRPTQIADELGFTLSGTSGVLTRLESAGLITRRHDVTAGDRRAVKLELTPRGEESVLVQLETFIHHAPELVAALRLTWRG
jgi:DNA-binding MarR family transcriptional regulator